MDLGIEGGIDGWYAHAMPLMKLQTDIDYELIQRLEAHKQESGKSKAAIVAEALRQYFAKLDDAAGDEDEGSFDVTVTPLLPPLSNPASGPASVNDLYPETEGEAPAPVNVENPLLPDEEHLADLKKRAAASKSATEIDQLTREIQRIEGERTMRLLGALPTADPTYVASRESG